MSRPRNDVAATFMSRISPAERLVLKLDVRCSKFDVECRMFDVRCSMFDVQCSMFDVQCSMFNVRCSMFDVRCSMFDVRCSMLGVECSIFDVPPSTFCPLVGRASSRAGLKKRRTGVPPVSIFNLRPSTFDVRCPPRGEALRGTSSGALYCSGGNAKQVGSLFSG